MKRLIKCLCLFGILVLVLFVLSILSFLSIHLTRWFTLYPLCWHYFNQDFIVPVLSFVDRYNETIKTICRSLPVFAAAFTIFVGIIAWHEYHVFNKKRKSVKDFLDKCDKISERISKALSTYGKTNVDLNKKYDDLQMAADEIIKDNGGLDKLNTAFLKNKIVKRTSIGVLMIELLRGRDIFKPGLEELWTDISNYRTKISDCETKISNCKEEIEKGKVINLKEIKECLDKCKSEKREIEENLIPELCACNEFMVEYLGTINDRIRDMYGKVVEYIRSPI